MSVIVYSNALKLPKDKINPIYTVHAILIPVEHIRLPTTITWMLAICLLGYCLYLASKSRTFQFFGSLNSRVETKEQLVALTFDDGPSAQTPEVLSILATKKVPATFYVIGQNAVQYPDELKQIISAGHEIGNHSYTHNRMILKSYGFIDTEISQTTQIIRDSGYTGPLTFRPPNGKKLFLLPWYLRQHHLVTIMWDVEPDTYAAGNAGEIVQYTLNHTRPGSIILMHPFCQDQCAADREALPQIIDGLKSRGYRFVTVSQLLAKK